MSDNFHIWDRSDYESTLIDMDAEDAEIGYVFIEDGQWHAEARGAILTKKFLTMRDAERAVESAVEEDGLL